MRALTRLTLSAALIVNGAAAGAQTADPLTSAAARGVGQTEAARITDNIWQAAGFGNTFLITTSEGMSYFHKLGSKKLTGKEHRNLTR